MRRIATLVGALTVLLTVLAAAPAAARTSDTIPLPNGFQPEGIAVTDDGTFYAGSLKDGSIYRGDVRTGQGDVIFSPGDVRTAVGLWYDEPTGHLFVAGGPFGAAHVYDGATGIELATYALGGAFVNDVVVTPEAAYFTDSFAPVIYKLPLGPHRSLPAGNPVETIPLGGDYVFDPTTFNGNGIEASGTTGMLILANSSNGTLYRVDPATGDATAIDLGGASVPNADGVLLKGDTLYVVQNFLNQIAEIRLTPDLAAGHITGVITSPFYRIPTTVGAYKGSLFAVNARFDVAPPFDPTVDPTLEYEVVRTPLH